MQEFGALARQLLQFSPDAMLVVDAGGRICFANDTAECVFGYSPEQLAGQLRRLAGDPALVERLGASARREVENEYDVEVVGPHLLAIYRELIARRKEAAA